MTQPPAGALCPSEKLDSGIVVDSGISDELGDTKMCDLFVLRGVFAAVEDIAAESFTGTEMTTATKALTNSELSNMLVGMPYITSDKEFPHGFQDTNAGTGESFWRTPPAVGMLKSFYKTEDGSYGIEWYGTVGDAMRFASEDVVHLSMANKSSINKKTGAVVRQMLHVAVLPEGEPPAWPGSRITSAVPLLPQYNTHMEEFKRRLFRKQVRHSADTIGRRAPMPESGAREEARVYEDTLVTGRRQIRAAIAAGNTVIAARNRVPVLDRVRGDGTGGTTMGDVRTRSSDTGTVILSLRSHTQAAPTGHPHAMSAPPAQNAPLAPAQNPSHAPQPAPVQQPAASQQSAPQQAQQQPPVSTQQQQQQQPAQNGAQEYIPFTEPLSTIEECEAAIKSVQNVMSQTLPHIAIEGATDVQAEAEKTLSNEDKQMLVNLRFRHETAKNTRDSLTSRSQGTQQTMPGQSQQVAPGQQQQTTISGQQKQKSDAPATDIEMREAAAVQGTVAEAVLKSLESMIHHSDTSPCDVEASNALVGQYQQLIDCRSYSDVAKGMSGVMEARERWSSSRGLNPMKTIAKNPTGDAAARQATFESMSNIGLQMRHRGRPSTRSSMPSRHQYIPQQQQQQQHQPQEADIPMDQTPFGRALAMMGCTIQQHP